MLTCIPSGSAVLAVRVIGYPRCSLTRNTPLLIESEDVARTYIREAVRLVVIRRKRPVYNAAGTNLFQVLVHVRFHSSELPFCCKFRLKSAAFAVTLMKFAYSLVRRVVLFCAAYSCCYSYCILKSIYQIKAAGIR